jgi:hypothetical protein
MRELDEAPVRVGAERRRLGAWVRGNLATQGYCLTEDEQRELAAGLRFSTGMCLALVVIALALESGVLLLVLVPIGAVAGVAARHPFDLIWNGAGRHVFGEPALPPNPPRRRHAFKVATVWLAADATLFLVGATTAGLVLGWLLVAACATVTATNLCIPSEALAWWDRHHDRRQAVIS